MAATRILSVIGLKNAGKTTLLVALSAEFARRGRRVMTIKHSTHATSPDQQGTDSWRHYHEGKAERVLMVTPQERILFERTPDTEGPEALARRYLGEADIVLVEGFKKAPVPKIEVYRKVAGPTPLFDPALPSARDWVAIVTDDARFSADCTVLRFTDTMWLQLLANLAWDRAKPLT